MRGTTACRTARHRCGTDRDVVGPNPVVARVCSVPRRRFKNPEEMDAGEQEHSGDVIEFVVSSRRRDDFIQPRRGERR